MRDAEAPWPADTRFQVVGAAQLDRAAYDALVAASPAATLFHSRQWLELFSDYPGASVHVLEARRGIALSGAMPFVVFRRAGFRAYFSTGFSGYGGPLTEPGHETLNSALLREFANVTRGFRTALTSVQDRGGLCGELAGLGFECQKATTHVVSLPQNFEAFLAQTHIDRNELTRAGRQGVVVETTRSAADFASWVELCDANYQFHGRQPYPRAFFAAVLRSISQSDGAVFHAARHLGKIRGGVVIFSAAQKAHYWLSAVERGIAVKGIIDALLAHAIRSALEGGARSFDFGASPPGAEGLAGFKQKWGGEPQPFDIYLRQNFIGAIGSKFVRYASKKREKSP